MSLAKQCTQRSLIWRIIVDQSTKKKVPLSFQFICVWLIFVRSTM